MVINKNIVNKIIDETDIIEVISRDINLEKKGNNYIGLCPFHQDNNPSFTISPEKKIYKCFVCGEGGNVIKYIQNKKKLSYEESIKHLAEPLNIQIKFGPKIKYESKHYVLEDVLTFYELCLSTMKSGKVARDYLINRGYSLEEVEKYRIGYSVNHLGELEKFLELKEDKKYTNYDVEQLNIINNGRDFFSDRLIFPICDDDDRVVGFSGRTLNDNEIKYLNSRDSDIFNKRNILYNLNNAKKYLEEKKIYIVEGFFDVISLGKCNINNVVGIMGTAFGDYHIKLLKKYNINEICLCLDNDQAGIKTTMEIAKKLLDNNITKISVVNLKDVKDIDEYISKHQSIKNIEYMNFFEYKIIQYEKVLDLSNTQNQQMYLKKVLERINVVDDELKLILINQIAKKLDIDSNTIMQLVVGDKKDIIANNNVDENHQEMPTEESYQEIPNNQKILRTKNNKKNDVLFPKEEESYIKHCLKNKESFEEIKKYVEDEKIEFNKYLELFNHLNMYYDQYNEYDYFDYLDTVKDDQYIDDIQRIIENQGININSIKQVVNSNKKPQGISLFRNKKEN